MNAFDIIILVIIGAALFFAVRRVRRKKTGCSCGCESCGKSCPMAHRK